MTPVRSPPGCVNTTELAACPRRRPVAGSHSSTLAAMTSRSSMAVSIFLWNISTPRVCPATITAAIARIVVSVLPTWRDARMNT